VRLRLALFARLRPGGRLSPSKCVVLVCYSKHKIIGQAVATQAKDRR
jgi:hypothetical protein